MIGLVQRYTKTPDGIGGYDFDWTDHITVSGTLDQLQGDEKLAADKISPDSTHIYIMFAIEDITEADRIIINKRVYNVKNVDNPNNLDRQLEILLQRTEEVVDDEGG